MGNRNRQHQPFQGSPSLAAWIFGALCTVCILLFSTDTQNANLIKEAIWWAALPGVAALLAWQLTGGRVVTLRESCRASWPQLRLPTIAVAIWVLWILFQTFRSVDVYLGTIAALRLTGYILTALLVAWTVALSSGNRVFLHILTWAAAVAGIYTLGQFAGFDFLDWQDERRPTGPFANPNFTADFLAAVLPLAIVLEFLDSPRGPILQRIPYRSILTLGGILITQSRGGAIGLMCGLAALGVLVLIGSKVIASESARRRLRIGILSLVLLGSLGLGSIVWTTPGQLAHLASTSTVQLRIELWRGCGMLFSEAPIIGWGTGSFSMLSQRTKYLVEPIAPGRDAAHAHSWIAETAVEHGAVGFLLFLFLVGSVLYVAIRTAGEHIAIQRAAAAGIVALLAATSVGVWFYWWGGGWTFWMLTGIIFGHVLAQNAPEELPKYAPHPPLLRKFLLSVFAALTVISPFLIYRIYSAEVLNQQGTRASSQGARKPARDSFSKAIKLNPFVPEYHAKLSQEHFLSGDHDAAKEAAERALEMRPGVARYLLLLAHIEGAMGEYETAKARFTEAWNIEPSAQIALRLAGYFEKVGDDESAERVMMEQMNRNVSAELLHAYLKFENQRGRTREARDFLSELQETTNAPLKQDTRAELARWEGELSFLLEEWVPALVAYQRAIRLRPKDHKLWNDYGLVLKRLQQFSRAERAFRTAEALAPEGEPGPTFNLLDLAIRRGDNESVVNLVAKLRAYNLSQSALARLQAVERSVANR